MYHYLQLGDKKRGLIKPSLNKIKKSSIRGGMLPRTNNSYVVIVLIFKDYYFNTTNISYNPIQSISIRKYYSF